MSVTVPAGRAEQARAVMIELFPEGFEELDAAGSLELAAYTNAAGEERISRSPASSVYAASSTAPS